MKPQQKNVFPISGECSFIPPLPIPSCFLNNNIRKQLKSEIYFDIYLYLKRYKYKLSANKCVSHQPWVLIYISIISSESLLKYYKNNLRKRFILIIFLHLYKKYKTSANKCVSHQCWVLIYLFIASLESLLKY